MAKVTKKTIPNYPGPTLTEVQAFSDAKVSKEMKRLQVEPWRPLPTFFDDPHEEDLNVPPKVWTPEEIETKEKETEALHQHCLRHQLFSAYIHEWLVTLNESALWSIIEDFGKEAVSLSERRYTSRAKLHERAGWAVYASEHKKTVNNQTKGGLNE